jgi:N-acetylglucosamine kinase
MQSKPHGLLLGIDAGGTNIRAAVSDTRFSLQEAPPLVVSAAEDGGPEPLHLLSDTLGRESVISVAAGITKVSRAGVVDRWKESLQTLFPNAVVRVVPDFEIAFHGAVAGGVGVAALAGTGSVIYGENRLGESVRVGGRGWEYGDEGSGSWLTTEIIRRTIRAMDGIDVMSPLCHSVCQYLGEHEDAGRLAEAARRETYARGRGFLVPLLVEQASLGDSEAANLFVGAAGWIGALVRTALRRLEFDTGEPLTIARVGGLWDVGPLLTDPFAQLMSRWYPRGGNRLRRCSPDKGRSETRGTGYTPALTEQTPRRTLRLSAHRSRARFMYCRTVAVPPRRAWIPITQP